MLYTQNLLWPKATTCNKIIGKMQPKGCTAADRYLNLTEVYFSIRSIGNNLKNNNNNNNKNLNIYGRF